MLYCRARRPLKPAKKPHRERIDARTRISGPASRRKPQNIRARLSGQHQLTVAKNDKVAGRRRRCRPKHAVPKAMKGKACARACIGTTLQALLRHMRAGNGQPVAWLQQRRPLVGVMQHVNVNGRLRACQLSGYCRGRRYRCSHAPLRQRLTRAAHAPSPS